MKLRHLLWIILLLTAAGATHAQVSNPPIIPDTTPPASCTTGFLPLWMDSSGTLYTCQAGVPTAIGGSGGAVSSVANSDGTLTISPTTGAVVGSLALGHANTWTAIQTQEANAITTPSNVGAVTSGPTSSNCSTYENAATPTFAQDCWTWTPTIAAGLNGASTYSLAHTGSTGTLLVSIPFSVTASNFKAFNQNTLLQFQNGSSTFDTGISRSAAGVVAFGTGATGSTAAVLFGAAFESGGTKFTATGCTSISATLGGATAGKFTIGANSCTVVITMNGATGLTVTTGYSCHANDETTAAGNAGLYFSTNGTTTATLTVPSTAAASDVIDFACTAF